MQSIREIAFQNIDEIKLEISINQKNFYEARKSVFDSLVSKKELKESDWHSWKLAVDFWFR